MAQLSKKTMIFIATDNWHTCVPLFPGVVLYHYHLLELNFLPSDGYHISGHYLLGPTHLTSPTMSEEDQTIQATIELL